MSRRAVLAAVLLGLLAAAPAGAQELSPPPDARIAIGSPVRFAVPVDVEGTQVRIGIARDASDLRDGLLLEAGTATPDLLDPLTVRWTAPRRAFDGGRPGRYVWQVRALAPGATEPTSSGIRRLQLVTPAAWQRRGPIPRWIGRRGSGSFDVSLRGLPRGVSARLFAATASTSGRRWGLRAARTTRRPVLFGDRRDSVGFGATVPAGALGVQRDSVWERVQVTRRCAGGRCTTSRRVVGRRVERDVLLRSGLPWSIGPEPPAFDHLDVESVLLHELGHFAGNKRHRSGCANSPMVEGMAMGEWWRTPRDRWSFCGAYARAAAAASASSTGPRRLRVVHQTVVRRAR